MTTPAHAAIAQAHAKVNLHLGVGHLRSDGFHELVTMFQSLDLHDRVMVDFIADTPAPAGQLVQRLEVQSKASHSHVQDVPTDSQNLAWRAAEDLYAWSLAQGGQKLPAIRIQLDKGIPVAGGMAGGSADAAGALVAVNSLLSEPAPKTVLLELAAKLGSDVPFTLLGHTQIGRGRGEELTRVLTRGTYHWALAFSKQGLSTPEVFAKLDTMEYDPHMDITGISEALQSASAQELAAHLHNDLQKAALSLRPDLRKTLELGQRAGALTGIVSGSGPTIAFLCEDEHSAQDVAAELGVFMPTVTASGPAPGAHLV